MIAAAMFMESLDGSILTNALPAMAPYFGVTAIDLKISVTAYLVAVAVCIPASGAIAARIGPVRLFQASMALFTLASVGCALSGSVAELTLGRLAQGVAASAMLPVGRLIVLRDMPKERLVRAVAMLTWPALLAPIVAPLLGGILVQFLSWQWIFLVNVPVGLITIALAPRLLPAIAARSPAAFDWSGFAAWTCGAVVLVGGVGEAGRLPIETTLVLGVTCAALFAGLAVHLRISPRPLFDLYPMTIASFRHTIIGGSLVRTAIFANPLLLPLMLQIGFRLSPVEAGTLILIGMSGNLAMKPFTTTILLRLSYRMILLGNGALLTTCFALFTLVGPATPRPLLIALLVITGMTRSMHFTALNTLAFRDVPGERMGDANTIASTTQQVNAALGAAVGALAVEAFMRVYGTADMALPAFHFAFAAIAVLCGLGSLESLRLPATRTYPLSPKGHAS